MSKANNANDVEAAAQALLTGRQARQTYASVARTHGIQGLDGAYDVQDRFVDLLRGAGGGAVVGYKIALTSKTMQEMCGVDRPLAGVLLEGGVRSGPATVRLSDFQHVGLEFETAVFLARDMPPRDEEYQAGEVAGFVATCAPAFELVEDRGADYAALDAVGITADNAWNGGVVLGAPSEAWRTLDLAAAKTMLDWSGREPEVSSTGAAMGHPFAAVAWVANHLNARGSSLKAGEVVMTGSTMKTRFPVGGEKVRYTIEGLGNVALSIEG